MLGNKDGYIGGYDVSSNDSVIFPQVTRGLFVGVSGNVKVEWGIPQPNSVSNTTMVYSNGFFQNVTAGTILPVRVRRIYAANTTANAFTILF